MLRSKAFCRFKPSVLSSASIIILSLIFSLSGSPATFGAQIKLSWDPNTESDLAGYKIYYGVSSGSYGSPVNVGNVTSYTLTGLTPGQTYFIAATAFNTLNNESGYSNEVSGAAVDPVQSYNITSNIPGLQITVDGAIYSSPQTFMWTPGSSHTISVSSPQSGGAGTKYVFSSWSDGGSEAHTITAAPSASTYTATFTTQYSLTTSASPSGEGTVMPPGVNWYESGQNVSVSASSSPGYSFLTWTGDLSGSTNPGFLAMSGPKIVTANFGSVVVPALPGSIVVSPSTGLSVSGTQGGPFNPSTQTYILENTGGLAVDWRVLKTQSWVTLSSIGGNLGPGAAATVTVSINGNANGLSAGSYSDTIAFENTTNGSGNTSRLIGLTVNPGTQTYTVSANASGLVIDVDGAAFLTSQAFQWTPGSIHALDAPQIQKMTQDSRYKFVSWSDGGAEKHSISAPATGTTYVANFVQEKKVKVTVSPPNAGTVTVSSDEQSISGAASMALSSADGVPKTVSAGGGTVVASETFWVNQGHKLKVEAIPDKGFRFLNWSGDLSDSRNSFTFDAGKPLNVVAHFIDTKDKALPIIGALESPSEGKRVLGLKTIYGWALDGEGISKIKLYIDEKFICDIPYGGFTEGLKEAYPDYPDADRGGFALVWNYSSLSPGAHFVQVEVQNLKGEFLNLGANVFVQKISGEMVSQVNGQELLLSGVKLTVDGKPNTYDLRIEWSPESDAFEIIDFFQ